MKCKICGSEPEIDEKIEGDTAYFRIYCLNCTSKDGAIETFWYDNIEYAEEEWVELNAE